MEPAVLYLVLVAGSAVVWLAGDLVWALGLWLAHRPTPPLLAVGRIASVVVAVMLVAASWKTPAVRAEVLPPSDRVIVSQDVPAVRTTAALTFRAMVETAGRGSFGYTVERGDCLWKIARKAIIADGDKPTGVMIATLWQQIHDINSEVIGANPRLIFPGQVLEIPER